MVSFFKNIFYFDRWFKYKMHFSKYHNTLKENQRCGKICAAIIRHGATGYPMYILWQESHHSFSLGGTVVKAFPTILFYTVNQDQLYFLQYSCGIESHFIFQAGLSLISAQEGDSRGGCMCPGKR